VDVCTSWEMDDLASLDDAMIQKLLDDGWNKNRVPKVEDVGGRRTQRSRIPQAVASVVLPSTLGFIAGAACVSFVLLARRP
jgi:precorrin-2 dehydrogenase / sirohydrochlorin ferrochelatase